MTNIQVIFLKVSAVFTAVMILLSVRVSFIALSCIQDTAGPLRWFWIAMFALLIFGAMRNFIFLGRIGRAIESGDLRHLKMGLLLK